jgi:hypothetical protein
LLWYSVYWLYYYKSTNTDAAGVWSTRASSLKTSSPAVSCTVHELWSMPGSYYFCTSKASTFVLVKQVKWAPRVPLLF